MQVKHFQHNSNNIINMITNIINNLKHEQGPYIFTNENFENVQSTVLKDVVVLIPLNDSFALIIKA